MTEHTVTAFDQDLNALSAQVGQLGELAVAEAADAISALVHANAHLAAEVVERDRRLDELELEVEERVVRLMALRQPVAVDLRRAVAAMKMASNLERCGDLAKNIAKRAIIVSETDITPALMRPIERMGELVLKRLAAALQAYADSDLVSAGEVWSRDREVDEHYDALFRELLTYMMGDPRLIAAGAHLLFVAKNLERIGDHASNIAEIVHYQITGEQLTARPKLETLQR
jgi:phosphate transport system protein